MLADESNHHTNDLEFMEDTNSLGGIKPIQRKKRHTCIVLSFVVGALVLFSMGFLIGYFVRQAVYKSRSQEDSHGGKPDDFEEFHEMFQESISTEKLESLMRSVCNIMLIINLFIY